MPPKFVRFIRLCLTAITLLGSAIAHGQSTPLTSVPFVLANASGANTIAVQADGKYIVGGFFNVIGGAARAGLARFNADGTLDSTWNPGANGDVTHAVHAGGLTYILGTFTTVGGLARNGLAAIDSSGQVTAFNPATDTRPIAIAATATTVAVAGFFSQVGGQARNGLAALDTAGNVLPWAPEPDDTATQIMFAGNELIVAGRFSTIAGQPRAGMAKFDATLALTTWAPAFTNGGGPATPLRMFVAGTDLLAFGGFDAVNGSPRNEFAQVSIATGAATALNPPSSFNSVQSMAFDGTTVYLGGQSVRVNGVFTRGLAAFDLATGNTVSGLPQTDNNAQGVFALGLSNGRLLAGGLFQAMDSVDAFGLARIETANPAAIQGQLLGTTIGVTAEYVVQADGKLVVGGSFAMAGAHVRRSLARINTDGSVDTGWNPAVRGYAERVDALAIDSNTVYVGGEFETVGGLAREFLAAIDSAGNVTPWNPQVNSPVTSILVSGGFVYLAGDFTAVGGTPQRFISQVDQGTGAIGVNLNGIVDGPVYTMALRGSTLYVGGWFTLAYNQFSTANSRNGLAAFDITTGHLTAWDPAITGMARIYGLAAVPGRLFVGGLFANIGGASRDRLASVNLTTGAADAWNPAPVAGEIRRLFVINDVLYTSLGAFDTTVNSNNTLNWGYPNSTYAPAGDRVYFLARPTGAGAFQFTFGTLPLASAATAAVKLAVTSINGGGSPRVNTNFTLTAESRDAANLARPVLADTTLSVALSNGTGTLSGGTTSCTILVGTTSCNFAGLRYSKAEANVQLTVSRASGDVLTAAQSAPFNVKTTVTVSVVKSPNVFTEVGQPATFVATVSGGSNPTGTVSFGLGGPGIGVAGCIPVTLAAGSATCTTSTQPATNLQVVAIYSGDAIHEPAESLGGANAQIAPFPSISILKTGGGSGTVSSTPAGIDCNVDCTAEWPGGTSVTLTAAPAVGSVFTGWSDGGCSGTAPCTQTLALFSGPRTVTANFELASVPLTVTRTGVGTGVVTSVPAGINCGADCDENYVGNTMVTLTATASGLSVFTGWSGGGCSGTGTCTPTLSAAQSVTADFTLPQYLLTVTSANGRVTSNPAGVDCPGTCAAPFNAGTMVTLTPTADSGFQFNGWLGACTGTGACVVSMDGGKSVTAQFGDPPPPPPALSSVSSIMLHGGFPESNPIQIGIPIDGNISIEPRLPNATSQLRFEFASTLTSIGGVTVKDRDGITAGQAAAQRTGNSVDVSLSGIVTGKRLAVRIEALNGSATFAEVTLAFLPGDASRSGRVTAADISAIKANIGRTFNQTSFARFDLNADDQISAADVSIAKARVGRGVQ